MEVDVWILDYLYYSPIIVKLDSGQNLFDIINKSVQYIPGVIKIHKVKWIVLCE